MIQKVGKRPRKPWVSLKDAKQMAENSVFAELKELAVRFATYPEREWNGVEITEFLHKRLAMRRKYGPYVTVDEEELPQRHVKLKL